MAPRENENKAYAKFGGDKQRTLWYVMVFSGVVNWIAHFFLPFVFPHVSAFKSNLLVHTYPTHIRIISITQDYSSQPKPSI